LAGPTRLAPFDDDIQAGVQVIAEMKVFKLGSIVNPDALK
jgi:hypothetical protein